MKNIERQIYFNINNLSPKEINIFVDDKPVSIENYKYIWKGKEGNHIIRIEQPKLLKSKWFWLSAPLVYFLGMFSGYTEVDGKTPCYAMYEADIFINKDIEVNVNLQNICNYKNKSTNENEYMVKVIFPDKIEVNVIRAEFTATKREKLRWFLASMILYTITFAFILFITISSIIRNSRNGNVVRGAVVEWILSIALIIAWGYIVYKLWQQAKVKHTSIK